MDNANTSYKFHPAAIHEFAAQLYWRRAHRDGVADIDRLVLATAGEAILESSLVDDALAAMRPHWGVADLPAEALRIFRLAAAAEALHRVRRELPLLGQVVFSDAQSGCAPGINEFVPADVFHKVREVPTKIVVNRTILPLGKLVLRSPLPAVVISETLPAEDTAFIRVPDTSSLGVAVALYLQVHAWDRYGDNLYLVTGNFLIPTKDAVQGAAWSRLIPNSTRFYRELKTQGMPDGDLHITTSW